MRLTTLFVAAVSSAAAPPAAFAGADAARSAPAAARIAPYAEGEIKKIDLEQGKVTLKHGPVDNLGMPGMTMVFGADAAALSRFKPGDAVKFRADRIDGTLKVTELVAR